MAKLRKMLGAADSPYIVSLMRLIETQSKKTLIAWAVKYAEENYLPIFEKTFPLDNRPRLALDAAKNWLEDKTKLPQAKPLILACHEAARETDAYPIEQAAARAIGQAASIIHTATHALGLAFYGAAAIAYTKAGLEADAITYDLLAEEECNNIEKSLRSIAVLEEPNPVKVNWNC